MSEETQNQEVNGTETNDEELHSLKARAKALGISHSPNIGASTLEAKINEHMEALEEHQPKNEGVTKSVLKARERKAARNAARRLVRIRLTNMNPVKKSHVSEIFTVSNNLVGTIRRAVPFGVTWHVESMLLNAIRERQMQVHTRKRDRTTGQDYMESKLVPEFSIEELPPLTAQELKDLGRRQQMADGTAELD